MNEEQAVLFKGLKTITDLISSIDNIISSNILGDESVKMNVTLSSFTLLEFVLSFIGNIALKISGNSIMKTGIIGKLTQLEVDTILEQETVLDTRTFNEKVHEKKYVKLDDKILLYPHLLSKVTRMDFSYSKEDACWNYFKVYKRTRDDITHMKFNYQYESEIPEFKTYEQFQNFFKKEDINSADVFKGILFLRDYLYKVNSLFEMIFYEHVNYSVLNFIDTLMIKLLTSYNSRFKVITESEKERYIPKLANFVPRDESKYGKVLYELTKK